MPIRNVDVNILADKTEGFVGADLENLCREAAMIALREDKDAEIVEMKHFEAALKIIKPSVDKDVMKQYENIGKVLEKVRLSGDRLERIAKHLPPGEAQGENVGILKFDGASATLLVEETERLIAEGGEGLPAPAAVDRLARRLPVRCLDVAGLPWAEIDFPEDLLAARERIWPLIA